MGRWLLTWLFLVIGMSSAAQDTVRVDFAFSFATGGGEGLFILGDHPLLGDGDVTRAPKMVAVPGTRRFVEWRLPVEFSPGTEFTYRYVLRDLDPVKWADQTNGVFVSKPLTFSLPDEEPPSGRSLPENPSPSRTMKQTPFDGDGDNSAIYIYLPPGYEDGKRHYPVLYMHDGQNLFASIPDGPFGQWNVDTTADALIEAGRIPPIIIVGVANGPARIAEYSPPSVDFRGESGTGDQMARYYIDQVKPYIDRQFRALPSPADTAVCGSSMGGLFSAYLLKNHREEFAAKAACLSPSFVLFGDWPVAPGDAVYWPEARLWLDSGTGTEPHHDGLARTLEVRDSFLRGGHVLGQDFMHRVYPEAQHREAAWADRFDDVLLFLFGDTDRFSVR